MSQLPPPLPILRKGNLKWKARLALLALLLAMIAGIFCLYWNSGFRTKGESVPFAEWFPQIHVHPGDVVETYTVDVFQDRIAYGRMILADDAFESRLPEFELQEREEQRDLN